MSRKITITLSVAAALAALFFFSLKSDRLGRKAVSLAESAGFESSVGKASFAFPAKLIFENVTLKNTGVELRSPKVTVSFSAARFAARKPFLAIAIKSPRVNIISADQIYRPAPAGAGAAIPVGKIKIDNGAIECFGTSLDRIYAELALSDDKIEGLLRAREKRAKVLCRASGTPKDIRISLYLDEINLSDLPGLSGVPAKISVKSRIADGALNSQFKAAVGGANLHGSGVYSGGVYKATARWKTGGEIFDHGEMTVEGDASELSFDVRSGESFLSGAAQISSAAVSVDIASSSLRASFPGFEYIARLGFKGVYSTGGRVRALAFLAGEAVSPAWRRQVRIDAEQTDSRVRLRAKFLPEDISAVVTLDDFRDISGELRGPSAGRAGFSGRIFPTKIDFFAQDWDMAAVAYSSAAVSGRLNMRGEFSHDGNEWLVKANAAASRFFWDGYRIGDVSAKILAGRNVLYITDAVLDNRVRGYYKNVYGRSRDISIVADAADVAVFSAFLREKLAGRISGKVLMNSELSAPLSGRANLKISGLIVGEKRVGDISASAGIAAGDITVDKFSLTTGSGSVSGGLSVIHGKVTGLFGFSAYPVAPGFSASGRISVAGKYKTPDDFRVNLSAPQFEIVSVFGQKSPLTLTVISDRDSYKFQDVSFGAVLSKNIAVTKGAAGRISGEAALRDYNLADSAVGVKGRLSADLNLAGTLAAPAIDARYKADNLSAASEMPSGTLTGSARFVDGKIILSDNKFLLPRASAAFSGVISDVIDITGNIYAKNIADIIKTGALASGQVSARFRVTGPVAAPDIAVEGETSSFAAPSVSLDKVKFKGGWRASKIFVEDAVLKSGENEIKILSGSVCDPTSGVYDVKLLVGGLRAGPTSALGRITLRGRWDAASSSTAGSLTMDDFWVGGRKFSKLDMAFSGAPSGVSLRLPPGRGEKFNADLTFAQSTMTAKIEYVGRNNDSLDASCVVAGKNLTVQMSARAFPIETVFSMSESPLEIAGLCDADISVSGDISSPSAAAKISIAGGTLAGIAFDACAADLAFGDNMLTVEAGLSRANTYRLAARGKIPVSLSAADDKKTASMKNDFVVTLEDGRLSFLNGFNFVKKADGPVTGRLELKGTKSTPKLAGFLKIENASAELTTYLAKINNLNLVATLKDNVLAVENLSGRSGVGRFLLKGTASLENFAVADMDFTFQNTTASGIDLFVPELPIPTQFSRETGTKFVSSYSYGKPRFDLTIRGDARKKYVLAGWVRLDSTYFSYPPPPPTAIEPPSEILKKLELDLKLATGENTWYENELVSVNIDGALSIKGNYYAPAVVGSVESKRGYISYLGTEFKIQSARLEVSGEETFLEGAASKQMPSLKGYDTVQIIIDRALIGKIQPRFVSLEEPALSSEKVLAKVVGIDIENSTPQERDLMLRQGLIRLLDSSLATPFAKTLLRRSGIVDTMKVSYAQPTVSDNTQKQTSEALPEILRGTKYTFEKYITDQMLLGYSVTLDEYLHKLDLKHEIEVAYRWKGNVFLRGIYELESKSLIRPPERRITIEQQWRFGWPKKR